MQTLRDVLIIKGLSSRQTEIAELVARGLSNKEIGVQLFITEKTVKFLLTQIYNKMNVAGRAQLIVWCMPHLGYLTPNEAKTEIAQLEHSQFVNYCMSFYGPGQMYSHFFKTPVTPNRVRHALSKLLEDDAHRFDGDSVDRERIREIMMAEEPKSYELKPSAKS